MDRNKFLDGDHKKQKIDDNDDLDTTSKQLIAMPEHILVPSTRSILPAKRVSVKVVCRSIGPSAVPGISTSSGST